MDRVDRFFRDYVAAFNQALGPQPDPDRLRTFYADAFLVADPHGAQVGHNDETFARTLEKKFAFYRAIGTRRMRLVRIDRTPIDALHEMARVRYGAEYVREAGEAISVEFDVTYLLEHREGRTRIFAFVAGDELALFRELGLVDEAGNPT